MPTDTGTNLIKNYFKSAMKSSYPVAVIISQFVRDMLFTNQAVDARILALYTYYNPLNIALAAIAARRDADLIAKKAATKQVVTTVAGMKIAVRSWVRQIIIEYEEGSERYDQLLIGGRKEFYSGSRASRLIRVNALITAIGSDASLADLKLEVQAYADVMSGKTLTQTGKKGAVDTDITALNAAVDAAAEGVWYCFHGLMMVFISTPKKVLAYFPMELIYNATHEKSYTLRVPKREKRKICMRFFKPGDTVTMENLGTVDLLVAITQTAKWEPTAWYLLPAGAIVTISPSLLGSTAYKFVMVKNDDFNTTGDMKFTIHAA